MPKQSDAEYEHSDPDTFKFLPIIVRPGGSDELRYEVACKFRMGSRVVNPDKTLHFPEGVQTWTKHMMQNLSLATDEALWRP